MKKQSKEKINIKKKYRLWNDAIFSVFLFEMIFEPLFIYCIVAFPIFYSCLLY